MLGSYRAAPFDLDVGRVLLALYFELLLMLLVPDCGGRSQVHASFATLISIDGDFLASDTQVLRVLAPTVEAARIVRAALAHLKIAARLQDLLVGLRSSVINLLLQKRIVALLLHLRGRVSQCALSTLSQVGIYVVYEVFVDELAGPLLEHFVEDV